MEGPTPRDRSLFLLGVSMLALGGILHLQTQTDEDLGARIRVSVIPPDGLFLFNGTIDLVPGNATALDALVAASERANFTVTVTYQYGPAFVTEVAGHRNEGICGWLYHVNDQWVARAADQTVLHTGDHVRWYWGCGG